MWIAIWLNWAICAITSLSTLVRNLAVRVFLCVFFPINIPDESVEEQGGVADNACCSGLFMLTALQGQPVVHVTFRM